jgi:hypothetical protein
MQRYLKEVSDWSTMWDARNFVVLAWIINNDVMFYATSEINVRFYILFGQSIRWFCRHLYSLVGLCALFLWFIPCLWKVLLLIHDYQTFFSFWNLCSCSLYKRIFMGHHYPHPTVRAHGVANCAGECLAWWVFFFNNGFLTPHLIGFWYSFIIPNLNVII